MRQKSRSIQSDRNFPNTKVVGVRALDICAGRSTTDRVRENSTHQNENLSKKFRSHPFLERLPPVDEVCYHYPVIGTVDLLVYGKHALVQRIRFVVLALSRNNGEAGGNRLTSQQRNISAGKIIYNHARSLSHTARSGCSGPRPSLRWQWLCRVTAPRRRAYPDNHFRAQVYAPTSTKCIMTGLSSNTKGSGKASTTPPVVEQTHLNREKYFTDAYAASTEAAPVPQRKFGCTKKVFAKFSRCLPATTPPPDC